MVRMALRFALLAALLVEPSFASRTIHAVTLESKEANVAKTLLQTLQLALKKTNEGIDPVTMSAEEFAIANVGSAELDVACPENKDECCKDTVMAWVKQKLTDLGQNLDEFDDSA